MTEVGFPNGKQEPNGWELLRALERIEKSLANVVTVEVMRLYQSGNDERHNRTEESLANWIAESKKEHVRLDGKIDDLEDKQDRQERQAREMKQSRWLTAALTALGWVVAIGIALMNRGAG